ncbi:MAG: two-component regulator propeller domain-containing protein [Chitinophagales bacterium]
MKKTMTLILGAILLQSAFAAAPTWMNISNYTRVTAVLADGNEVWVAAKGGLMRYSTNSGNRNFYKKAPGALPSLSIEALARNVVNGDIWIGTYDNGLVKFDGNQFTTIPLPSGSGKLYTIKTAPDGAVWAVTENAVYQYKNGTFNTFLAAMNVWDVAPMPNGKLFCGNTAPFIFDPATQQSQMLHTSTFSYSHATVAAFDDHHFAFASDHSVLATFVDTTEVDTVQVGLVQQLKYESSGKLYALNSEGQLFLIGSTVAPVPLVGQHPVAVDITSTGVIWGGATDTKGACNLFGLAGGSITNISLQQNQLASNWVYRVTPKNNNTLLLQSSAGVQEYDLDAQAILSMWDTTGMPNTYGGGIEVNGKKYLYTSSQYLWVYQNGQWQQLGVGILPSSEIRRAVADAAGNLWLCGYGYIAKYDGNNFTVYDASDDYHLTQYVHDIHIDETHGNVWFGTYDGIFKLHNNALTFYNDSTPGIQQFYDPIECISEDPQHNIWFGTVYGGLIKYDGNGFSTQLLPYHVGNQMVTDMVFDGNTMYVSDNLNSLWKLENGVWDSLNIRTSGVTSNFVTSLLLDKRGNLWLSNLEYGIDIYNKNGVTLTGVTEPLAISAEVMPNPSTGRFLVRTDGAAQLRVWETTGRLLTATEIDREGTIDLTNFSSGCYWLEIQTAAGTTTRAIFKQ